jgi:tRNA nucleotidyltransferase (CCA-adding enzyme)
MVTGTTREGTPLPSGTIDPPPAVRDIALRLERAGHETWCVGGAVRDALLGHPHLDWDLATAATPDEVRRLFRRTVPHGVEFGTIGVIDRDGRMHEVTTFREDVETDGRHARVRFGASLDEDLARRDFTINAIAYSTTRDELRDPFGGRDDLARGLLRTVGDPDARMNEDRLRALRAIRFATRFGFTIDPDTWKAIERSAPHLRRLSAERVKQELEKTMDQVAQPGLALEMWRRSGALAVLLPPLASFTPVAARTLDCLALPRADLAARPQRRILRLAALFLDLDAGSASRAMRAMRFSNADTAWIAGIVERWRQLSPDMEESLSPRAQGPPAAARVRGWAAAIGRTRVPHFFRVAAARWNAMRIASEPGEPGADHARPRHIPDAPRVHAAYRVVIHAAYHDPIELADLAIDGDDLARVGIGPGPAVGRILHALLGAVLEDPRRNTRDTLLALAETEFGHEPHR